MTVASTEATEESTTGAAPLVIVPCVPVAKRPADGGHMSFRTFGFWA